MNRMVKVAIGAAALLFIGVRRQRPSFQYRGKTVLITGGSRGLGLVLARQLLARGARVAVCARDVAELERAEADLKQRGSDVLAVRCDISDYSDVVEMMRTVERLWGGIDILINNAGIIEVGPMETMTVGDYDAAFKTHFWGPLHTVIAALPTLKRRRGRIVNISSIGGKIAAPHLLPYSASKFALVGFSEGLRTELKKDGIIVTTVCPGLMRTGSPINADFKSRHRAEYAWFAIADALPVLSIGAERAARQILAATALGRGEVVLGLPAKFAVAAHGVAPALVADLLAHLNRALPKAGGIEMRHKKGRESASALAPSVLTALSDWAAIRNNERPA